MSFRNEADNAGLAFRSLVAVMVTSLGNMTLATEAVFSRAARD
jgi:hypothetical protein